jgi:hypothetical protein
MKSNRDKFLLMLYLPVLCAIACFYYFCLFFQEERFVFHLENAIILVLYHISNHTMMIAIGRSVLDEIFLDEAELNI